MNNYLRRKKAQDEFLKDMCVLHNINMLEAIERFAGKFSEIWEKTLSKVEE